ncbi:MAG: ECF transporter S component [Enterococcus sp.]
MFLKKNFVKLAMLTALTVTLSMMFIFPVPATNGFVTLCEVGIYTSAFLFGPIGGFWVGALSGGMIDMLSGYPQWAIFSIVIHGVQGLIAGYLYYKKVPFKTVISLVAASLFMVAGYALATAFLYDWPAGVASILGNIIQNCFGILVTVPLIAALKKVNIKALSIQEK